MDTNFLHTNFLPVLFSVLHPACKKLWQTKPPHLFINYSKNFSKDLCELQCSSYIWSLQKLTGLLTGGKSLIWAQIWRSYIYRPLKVLRIFFLYFFIYSFIPPQEKGGTPSIWVCKSAFSFPLAVLSAKAPPLIKCPGGGQAHRTKVVGWLQQNRSLRKVRKIRCRGGATKACAPNIKNYINGRAAQTKILSHDHSVSALPLPRPRAQAASWSPSFPTIFHLQVLYDSQEGKKSSFAIQTEFLYQNWN